MTSTSDIFGRRWVVINDIIEYVMIYDRNPDGTYRGIGTVSYNEHFSMSAAQIFINYRDAEYYRDTILFL